MEVDGAPGEIKTGTGDSRVEHFYETFYGLTCWTDGNDDCERREEKGEMG